MKCPYRKHIRTYQDGLETIERTDFAECIEDECPHWGVVATKLVKIHETLGGYYMGTVKGCRKAENECS